MCHMAYRGKYVPTNRDKYIGDVTKIRYLSSWELKMFVWCDKSPKVVRWNSEDFIVKYLSPIDNRIHRYLIDVYVEVLQLDGSIQRKLLEIKPAKECKPPRKSKNMAHYYKALRTWKVNEAKWASARHVAEMNNMTFHLITEKELGI